MTTEYRDFKYVLQEMSRTMIGARFTYGELLQEERVPFKFQTIVDRLILPYVDADREVGEHILSLTPEDKNTRIYAELKLKVKYFAPSPKGGFKEYVVPLKELMERKAVSGMPEGTFVQEIILSNLALLAFKM